MTDESWRNAPNTWDRVKWARSQRFRFAREAADALGMPASTYRQYERDPKVSRSAELTQEYAKQFGRKFAVNWAWLMTGKGSPGGVDIDADLDTEEGRLFELVKIYSHMSQPQRDLLYEVAKNMVHPNVVELDALPPAPSVAKHYPSKSRLKG